MRARVDESWDRIERRCDHGGIALEPDRSQQIPDRDRIEVLDPLHPVPTGIRTLLDDAVSSM